MKYIFSLLVFVILCLSISCGNDVKNEDDTHSIPENWQMIEMFADEIPELNEGAYYPLFYNHDNPMKDSFGEADDRIVALAVEVEDKHVIAWVGDSKQKMKLKTDESKGNNKFHRVYVNDLFTVDLSMRLVERIDGMDEEDMLIYAGKMKISQNGTDNSKEYRVKGGI